MRAVGQDCTPPVPSIDRESSGCACAISSSVPAAAVTPLMSGPSGRPLGLRNLQPGLLHARPEALRTMRRPPPGLQRASLFRTDSGRPEHPLQQDDRLGSILIYRAPSAPNLHVAFDLAVESGYMPRNPATRKIAPKVRKRKVKPYDEEEVRKLIDAALGQFGGVRWVIALALGLRQGELALHNRGCRWGRNPPVSSSDLAM